MDRGPRLFRSLARRGMLFATPFLALFLQASPAPGADYVTIEGVAVTQGEMRVRRGDGERTSPRETVSPRTGRIEGDVERFILEETRVDAEISGVLARVRLVQVFQNPYAARLEAVYLFPLPEDAAVDAYAFRVGETVVHGVVKEREEARRQYERARDEGRKGALLEEERANVFTQSLANIPPGGKITVHIEYAHPVEIDGEHYTFRFPMVVAPRYMPGQPLYRPNVGRGWARDTDQVPDASRVSSPVLPEHLRSGNDVHITVRIDAGMPIQEVVAATHGLEIERRSETEVIVGLGNGPTLANKDFVLEYRLAGDQPVLAALAHRGGAKEALAGSDGKAGDGAVDEAGAVDETVDPEETVDDPVAASLVPVRPTPGDGYVCLVLQPKREVTVAELVPREVILVMDRSGSMRGASIGQLRVFAQHVLGALNPQDVFRLVAFDDRVKTLDSDPLPATPENVASGEAFIRRLTAGSGTEMLPALESALGSRGEENGRPRYMVLLSDALVGNDDEILGYLNHPRLEGVRVFPVAIGGAPNHYLIERAAEIGRGFAMSVTNQDNPAEMARRWNEKAGKPYITDLELDWGGLEVRDVLPDPLPDLYAGKPLVVLGRYDAAGRGKVTLRGNLAGSRIATELDLELPEREAGHDALPSIWARHRVRGIWNRHLGRETAGVRDEITRIGLAHQLVTRYTSFVAVEKSLDGDVSGDLRTVDVPVMLPEGMTHAAAPRHAFARDPRTTGRSGRPPSARRASPPRRSSPPPPPRSDGGERTRRRSWGGGGGGSIEWLSLLALALLAGGRALAGRRRKGSS